MSDECSDGLLTTEELDIAEDKICKKSLGISPYISNDSLKLYKVATASALGSATATLSLNPITVLKVRLQKSIGSAQDESSLRRLAVDILRKDGILGFWAGVRVGLVQSLPSTMIYMTAYEHIKAWLHKESIWGDSSSRALLSGVAAGMARVVPVTVIAPLEMIRTMQTGGLKMNMLQIAKVVWKESGVFGFYKGLAPTILRDMPYSFVYWLSFEWSRPWISNILNRIELLNITTRQNENDTIYSNGVNFIAGAASGTLAAIITQPFDVVKTKMQLQPMNDVTSKCDQWHKSIKFWDTLSLLYKQGGTQALFRGLSMRLATVIPGGAIMVTVYEAVKHFESSL